MHELTKRVPAHNRTVRFRWVKQEFVRIGPSYRAIRARFRNPMDMCFWCKHQFEDGEMMALAAREKGANVVLCQSCASATNAL